MVDIDQRGSTRLIDAYRKRGVPLDEGLVVALSDSLGKHSLNDLLVNGQPNPEWLRAAITVEGVSEASATLEKVLGVLGTVPGATIRVFPKGIPWPEVYNLEITVGQR